MVVRVGAVKGLVSFHEKMYYDRWYMLYAHLICCLVCCKGAACNTERALISATTVSCSPWNLKPSPQNLFCHRDESSHRTWVFPQKFPISGKHFKTNAFI